MARDDKSAQHLAQVVHITSVHRAHDVRIFYKQARGLARLGYSVVLAAPGSTPYTDSGVYIIGLGHTGGSRVSRIIRCLRALLLMLRTRASIFHLHDPELLLFAYIPSLLGRKLIFDVHEFYVQRFRELNWIPKPLRRVAARTYDRLERIILPRFSGVVVAVETMCERYASIVGPERVAVVRNYPYILEADRKAAHDEGHPLKEHPYILHTGGVSRLRGFHTMVQAAEYLRERGCTWPLINLGRIDLSEYSSATRVELTRRAAAAGIDNLGIVPQSTAWRYCAHAAIGVIFLAETENNRLGHPNKLYEYLAFGLPVVAPNLGVVAETVRKTASGLVFRPADGGDAGQKILKLVRDQRTRESLSQNSLNASRLFDFERELEALTGLYQRVLKSPGTVHPSYMGTRGRR